MNKAALKVQRPLDLGPIRDMRLNNKLNAIASKPKAGSHYYAAILDKVHPPTVSLNVCY